MSNTSFTIVTTVGETERPMVIAGARQFSAAIEATLKRPWPVNVLLSDREGRAGSGTVWIASMIDDVERNESLTATTRRWHDRIDRWAQRGSPRILLSTLFRGGISAGRDRTLVERIRRLNMMALALSRDTTIEIVDVDRLFAWCGARTVQADYRCIGERAAEIGGHAIAAALFAGSLDDILPEAIQEQATAHHGGTRHIADILKRRIPTT